ncbi:MAG: DUF6206 family protein [Anaerolineae bacterium]
MPENMPARAFLARFEAGLNPRRPEHSTIPARILGYGEISTVFEIAAAEAQGWACKRMPMFRNASEAQQYEALYREYVRALSQMIGLRVAAGEVVRLDDPAHGRTVLYILQERFPAEAIGHRAIQRLAPTQVVRLVEAVLKEAGRVFAFNQAHQGVLELGLDGQISNWAIVGWSGDTTALPASIELVYLDTSTPLMRRDGQEQLDPELLLRSAPSFTLWFIRRAFLPEVMTRYYDFRRVALDLVANFYKEGRPELVTDLVATTNAFFRSAPAFRPLTVSEVRDYYRFDALIWRVFLALRKFDRVLQTAAGRSYPYILPEKIKR